MIQRALQERQISAVLRRFHCRHRSVADEKTSLSLGFLFDFAPARLLFPGILGFGFAFGDLIFYRFTFPSTCHSRIIPRLVHGVADKDIADRCRDDAIPASGFRRVERMARFFDQVFRKVIRLECR